MLAALINHNFEFFNILIKQQRYKTMDYRKTDFDF